MTNPASPPPPAELSELLKAYREAVIDADHCYGEGNESEALSNEAYAESALLTLYQRQQEELERLRQKRRPTEIDEVAIMEGIQAERTLGEAFEDAKATVSSQAEEIRKKEISILEALDDVVPWEARNHGETIVQRIEYVKSEIRKLKEERDDTTGLTSEEKARVADALDYARGYDMGGIIRAKLRSSQENG